MKKTIFENAVCFTLLLATLFYSQVSFAQVKIGGTPAAPDASAVLELDGGSTRGLLLPRMRKIDMLAIVSPAEGLTLYVTDEQATYLRRQGSWIKLSGSGDIFELPYTGIFSVAGAPILSLSNLGNNGIGLFGASNVGAGTGVHGFATSSSGYGVKGTSNLGRGGYFSSKFGHALVTDTGKIGLGTVNPSAFLEIDATKNNADTTVIINDDDDPTIQFKKSGLNKSYIKQEGNNLVLRPNGQNFAGKVMLQAYNDGGWMFVDANGNSSFGQDPATFNGTPNNVRVHVRGNSSNVLALEAPTGTSGPRLSFIDRTNNVINNMGSIRSDDDAMTFGHKNSKYEWGTDMRLKHDPGLFSLPELCVAGFIGTGTGFIFKPEAPLHVFDVLGAANTMILDAITPTINFKTNTVDKAFIQQTGNDLKIGTYTTNDPGRFIVRTNGADRVWVDSVGYVTIGAKVGPTLNGPYKLAVRGKVAATEFNVVAIGSWPDYVFDDSYQLRSLEETEAFIKVNKHLPNIPAAAVVEKEGFGLAEMQKLMMEKIEELTLHLIEANKEIKILKAQMAAKN
jgi:hypothetical protein